MKSRLHCLAIVSGLVAVLQAAMDSSTALEPVEGRVGSVE